MAEKKRKEKKEKPLEKWTVKELREEAAKISNVQGLHGMNKEELLNLVRETKGVAEPGKKKKSESVRETKKKVAELRTARDAERAEGASRARLKILRRKMSRLKKKTRR